MLKSTSLTAIIIILFIIFNSCSGTKQNNNTQHETIVYQNSFETEEAPVNHDYETRGFHRSKDVAFDGEWSLKVTKKQNYQINLKIDNILPGEVYDIAIWRYGNKKSFISVIACNDSYKVFSSSFIKESRNGWDLIIYRFKLPPFTNNGDLLFYVTNYDTIPAYYDNITVTKYMSNKLGYNNDNFISLDFDTAAINTLTKTRERAIKAGVYEVHKEDKVNGKIKFGNDTTWHTAEIRLKGDWVTHLQEYRWSFRIKLTDGYFWNGMRTFSIQKPDTRGHIYEWLFHKYLEQEGVLTTRYGFVPVKINGTIIGTYAWEEHFEKQIVEHRKKREGPIIKFDESLFWKINKYNLETQEWYSMPFIQSATIIPFKKKRTLKKNKNLKKIFENGQNNLYSLKYGTVNENIVDFDAYSKLYALIDIFTANHMYIFHNRRFYINPVSMKLEPVAFDGFTEKGFHKYPGPLLIGYKKPKNHIEAFEIAVFQNKQFVAQYYNALKKYANLDNIKAFIDSNKNIIDDFVYQINLDEPYYSFDTTDFFQHIKAIANELDSNNFFSKLNKTYACKKIDYTQDYTDEFVEDLVVVYKEKTEGKTKISFENYNSKAINIIGLAKIPDTTQFDISNKIQAYKGDFNNNRISFYTPYNPKYIFFKIEGNNKLFRKKINNWKAPVISDIRTDLLSNALQNNNIYTITNNKIIFKQGKHRVFEKIIIPKGYKVIINKGTQIDFVRKSCFYSESPVFINGTKQDPVVFKSSDKTAEGIFILETKEKSEIRNMKIIYFNTFSYKGWKLTGAITFYKADVFIDNISVQNNLCEDAINMISNNFEVINSNFSNIFSDAFDSDFCNGSIKTSVFTDIGNDGVDFSTSEITVENCNFKNIGDKAVSAGENSNVTVTNISVDKAGFGFVSKDKSSLKVSNSNVENSDYCYAAYIKKMEYGISELTSENITQNNNKNEYLIDKGCSITINNTLKTGNKKIYVDSLYAKWKKQL